MIGNLLNNLLAIDSQTIIMLVIVVVLVAVIVVFYILSNKKRKKQEQDAQDLINAVKPGNKVKTIGGICGIVVEVDNEENTFVLETGTEQSGKSYIKFDRQAIYQTDAVVEKKDPTPVNSEDKSEETEVAETPAETEVTEQPAEAVEEVSPVEEAPAQEEQAPANDNSVGGKKKKKQ